MTLNFESIADELLQSGLFDSQWYSENFPDAALSGLPPLTHFLRVGMRLDRDPGPLFDAHYYLTIYPDVRAAGFHPLIHYLRFGRAEGRQAARPATLVAEAVEQTSVSSDGRSLLLREAKDAFGLRGLEPNAPRAILVNAPTDRDWTTALSVVNSLTGKHDLFVLGPLLAFRLDDLPASVRSVTDVGLADEVGNARGFVRLAASGALDGYESLLWLSPADALEPSAPANATEIATQGALFEKDANWGMAGQSIASPLPDNAVLASIIATAMSRIGFNRENVDAPFASDWAIWLKPLLLRALGLGLPPDEMIASASTGQAFPGRTAVLQLLALIGREAGMDTRTLSTQFPEGQGRAIKTLAFYLPQFHPIPENDRWWGKGFTEWSNVTRARPMFQDHYQPRYPADLGFYDLRLEDVQIAQAQLTREFGVHGFCFHYYWFNGKKLLNHPIEQMYRSRKIDTGFCVCWANENWSRSWDGQNREILIEQHYSLESNIALIRELIPMMKDPRWVRHQGKPVMLVYRISIIPNWLQTAHLWREECRKAGLGEIHLCAVRFALETLQGQPEEHGLDAYVLFPPHEAGRQDIRHDLADLAPDFRGEVFSYEAAIDTDRMRHVEGYEWPVHRGAMLAWDNSARRTNNAVIFHGATPYSFRCWMKTIVEQEALHNPTDESLIFINAWNEWAEGTYLEPDQRWGKTYLAAFRSAVDSVPMAQLVPPPSTILPAEDGTDETTIP